MTDVVAGGEAGRRLAAVRPSLLARLDVRAKRMTDVVLALVALVALAPLFLAAYLAVRLTSPGGGLFRQTRMGAGQRPFTMYKFRTMVAGCDEKLHRDYVQRLLRSEAEATDGLFKLSGDPRVTRVGAFLRRTSLDELPQLLNVLRGEMSLVGPRPSLPWEVAMFPTWAMDRFAVRPGLTGLWQISGRNKLTMLDGLRLDVEYVARAGVVADLWIILRTVPALLRGGAR